ncbi:ABC transporter substrate-binding protein [Paenibacillus albiflavus]|nr:extracellular solute-binding protein [Paenibacillus albiflavus]
MRTKLLCMLLTLCVLLTSCDSASSDSGATTTNPNPDPNGEKTIVIAVPSADGYLKQVAAQFEDLHPNIHFEIQEFIPLPKPESSDVVISMSGLGMEKYVQSVTTQVIAGKGADLIFMNNLPQDKFVEKNLLVNLYDLMEKDKSIDKSKYYNNILQASQQGDGLYAIPLSFSVGMVAGNTNLMEQANIKLDQDKPWTWGQFKDIGKQIKEQGDSLGFTNFPPELLLNDYLEESYPQLVQGGKANFDSDMFRSMMQEIKSMYDDGILSSEFTQDYDKGVFSLQDISSAQQVLMTPMKSKYYNKPTVNDTLQGLPFKVYNSLGINSSSKVQLEAWEFIKYLLSDEVQTMPDFAGLPVNKQAADKLFDDALHQLANGMLDSSSELLPDTETAKQRIEDVKKFMEQAGARNYVDNKVYMIVREEFATFMNGQKSAKDVSKLIQNRVTTYLNE